jgi:hypothetical protein
MEADDLDDWLICRRINELFCAKTSRRGKCILCSTIINPSTQPYTSNFWRLTSCWATHTQTSSVRPSVEVASLCETCDTYFVLNVAKGSLSCLKDGCRRAIRLKWTAFEASSVYGDAPATIRYKPHFRRPTVI